MKNLRTQIINALFFTDRCTMNNSPNGILFGLPKIGTAYAYNPLKNECKSYDYDFVFGRVIFVTEAECKAACMYPEMMGDYTESY